MLHAAAEQNAQHVLDLIRAEDLKDEQANTALHYAVDYNRVKVNITAQLLAVGANANVTNSRLVAPLHLVVRRGRVDITRMLLVNGQASSNQKDYNGNTPLHDAVALDGARLADENPRIEALNVEEQPERTHVALVDVLLSHGADGNLQNDTFPTALGYSRWIRTYRCRAASTRSRRAQDKQIRVALLHVAAAFDASERMWEAPIEHGADPMARSDDGKSVRSSRNWSPTSSAHKDIYLSSMFAVVWVCGRRLTRQNNRDPPTCTCFKSTCLPSCRLHFLSVSFISPFSANEKCPFLSKKGAKAVEGSTVSFCLARAGVRVRWRRS